MIARPDSIDNLDERMTLSAMVNAMRLDLMMRLMYEYPEVPPYTVLRFVEKRARLEIRMTGFWDFFIRHSPNLVYRASRIMQNRLHWMTGRKNWTTWLMLPWIGMRKKS